LEICWNKVVVESAEMHAYDRAAMEQLKGFITTTHDKHRLPYRREAVEIPRGFIVIGTTNNPLVYRDMTGERRVLLIATDRQRYDWEWFNENLLQLHAFDAATPVEEVLSTLDDLVRAGKLRYLGVSNFSGWQVMKSLAAAERHGWQRYVAHQVYYSLVGRDYEWELMPLGLDQGVGALVWSPLGWGRLTGKIRRGVPLPEGSRLHDTASFGPPVDQEQLYRVVDALEDVAEETGKTVPQIAINWLTRRPSVSSVIVGARNEEQLRQNLGAIGWSLSDEQIAKLDAASLTDAAYPYFPYRRQEAFARLSPPAV